MGRRSGGSRNSHSKPSPKRLRIRKTQPVANHPYQQNPQPVTQAPATTKRAKSPPRSRDPSPANTMLTSNDDLSTIDTRSDSSSNSDSNNDTSSTPAQKPKTRPIIIHLDDWPKAAKLIMPNNPNGSVMAKLIKNKIHISTSCSDDFRDIQDTLSVNKIAFLTFALPGERSLKVLIRGIPPSYSEETVKTELVLRGFEINHTRQFLKNGRRLPMFMTVLPNNPSSKQIFDISALFGLTVSVEPYRTSGPSQCFACQGFGHSSAHCGHPPRCVKCGADHATKSCSKTPDQPPKCCNCGGSHTANYRQCPSYVAALKAKKDNPTHVQSFMPPPPANQTNASTSTTSPANQLIASTSTTPTANQIITSTSTTSSSQKTYAEATINSESNPEPTVNIPKSFLTNLLSETFKKISESNDIKESLLTALSTIISLIHHDAKLN